MSNTKHTPGPWVDRKPDSVGGSRIYADCKGGVLIATLGYMRDKNESEANARLIAAAPDLLSALKLLLDEVTEAKWPKVAEHLAILQIVCEAIAKADG